jgi:ABC-type uncharacterized transport system substrate-binding protein
MYGFRESVDAGGLMSYGSNQFYRTAFFVDKLLKGANPGPCLSSDRRASSWL